MCIIYISSAGLSYAEQNRDQTCRIIFTRELTESGQFLILKHRSERTEHQVPPLETTKGGTLAPGTVPPSLCHVLKTAPSNITSNLFTCEHGGGKFIDFIASRTQSLR